jgi:hypothetical protein
MAKRKRLLPAPGERALTIRSFSSRGVSHRIWSPKTTKLHHLMSNVELGAFLDAEWRSDVSDIDDQVALDVDLYNSLAKEVGAHRYPAGSVPSSDLRLSLSRTRAPFIEVWSCKLSAERDKPAVKKKLEIERRIWEDYNHAAFREITEQELKLDRANNLLFIRPFGRVKSWLPSLSERERRGTLDELRRKLIADHDRPTMRTCWDFDRAAGVPLGSSMAGVRYAIAQRFWPIEINILIDPAQPPRWLIS